MSSTVSAEYPPIVTSASAEAVAVQAPRRNVAVDAYRGLVMLLMMATILPLSNPFPLNFNMKKFELMSKAVATLMVTFSVKST